MGHHLERLGAGRRGCQQGEPGQSLQCRPQNLHYFSLPMPMMIAHPQLHTGCHGRHKE
jgi:hypothetical protein